MHACTPKVKGCAVQNLVSHVKCKSVVHNLDTEVSHAKCTKIFPQFGYRLYCDSQFGYRSFSCRIAAVIVHHLHIEISRIECGIEVHNVDIEVSHVK